MSKNNITWNQLSNEINDFGDNIDRMVTLDKPVILYDRSTGEEYKCDIYVVDEDTDSSKLVLMFNTDEPIVKG